MRLGRPPLLALALAVAACGGGPPGTGAGRSAPAAAAPSPGRQPYQLICSKCHGERGDGTGGFGRMLSRKPRDFSRAIFKFGSVPAGELPTDADLFRIVTGPVHGNAPFPLDDAQVEAATQYIKTMSPRWAKGAGTPVPVAPDPWGPARAAEAAARGAVVYYTVAECVACHPAYATAAELAAMNGVPVELRAGAERPLVGDSEFGPLAATDFARERLRGGAEAADVYRAIACGIGGTGMAGWKEALPEEDLWALVYFVETVVEGRSSATRRSAP